MVAFNNPNEELEAQLKEKTQELFDFCKENNIPLLIHTEIEDTAYTSLYKAEDRPVTQVMFTLIMQLQLMGLEV